MARPTGQGNQSFSFSTTSVFLLRLWKISCCLNCSKPIHVKGVGVGVGRGGDRKEGSLRGDRWGETETTPWPERSAPRLLPPVPARRDVPLSLSCLCLSRSDPGSHFTLTAFPVLNCLRPHRNLRISYKKHTFRGFLKRYTLGDRAYNSFLLTL